MGPPDGALVASAGALSIEDDDVVALKSDDAAERAAAAQLAHLPSDADLGVLLPSAGAVAGAAAGGGGGGDLGPEAEAALAQLQELYKDAYLSRALRHYDEFLTSHPGVNGAALAARLKAAYGIDLEVLRARNAMVAHGLRECEGDEGWRLVQDDGEEGLRLMYRQGPHNATTHCFKSGCILNCELHELLSMAREFDLVPTWNSYITQTDILQISSLVELMVYASVWLPWPFAERDVLIQAVGIDVLAEDGSLAISFASPEGGVPPSLDTPAGFDARTHVQIVEGSCMRLCPLPPKEAGGKPRTKVVVVTMLDSGTWVPEAIITFVLKVFAPFFFSAVVKVVESAFDEPDGPLPSRIAQRPELYSVMRERVEHFFAGHADAP